MPPNTFSPLQPVTAGRRLERRGYRGIAFYYRAFIPNGMTVGSGIYFYRMRSDEVVSTKKMMLLK
jgi:hypothetical protein